jgi:hypothetical protein
LGWPMSVERRSRSACRWRGEFVAAVPEGDHETGPVEGGVVAVAEVVEQRERLLLWCRVWPFTRVGVRAGRWGRCETEGGLEVLAFCLVSGRFWAYASVAELADALGLGPSGPTGCGGSSPPARTPLTCANASKGRANSPLRLGARTRTDTKALVTRRGWRWQALLRPRRRGPAGRGCRYPG